MEFLGVQLIYKRSLGSRARFGVGDGVREMVKN